MTKTRKYVASWDCLGFECLIDVTDWEQQYLMETMRGDLSLDEMPSCPAPIEVMMIRARMNPQRDPEIWTFTSAIPKETLDTLMEDEPQLLVDAVRSTGTSIFRSNSQNEPKRII